MKTIAISTTNLIYYLTKNQDVKLKLLDEIMPVLTKVSTNLMDLDYDTVMDFNYLMQCYNESLRIEPPAAVSMD